MSMSPPLVENELHREFMGVNGLSFADRNNSASRKQMYSSHLSQALVIRDSEERLIQTGMEREYGKYTFSVKMPVNAHIIRVIDRYRQHEGIDSIPVNPQTVIIYEDSATKEVGILSVPLYCSYHQYFGFQYKRQPGLADIRKDAYIPAGTVLMDSPAKTENGGWGYGLNLNVAYMSHPAVSEDGIVISRDVLPRLGIHIYETRVIEWGGKSFPLNLYGKREGEYKIFPDIGEPVREDGILCALRTYDPYLAPVEQGVNDVKDVHHTFDKKIYASGPGGRVVDIRIHHDRQNYTPIPGRDDQVVKYDNARVRFYEEILAEYKRLEKSRGVSLSITREFHRLVVEAISVVASEEKERIQRLYRQTPLDEWRVEIVVEYPVTPNYGFKLTDGHGGKGVICHIAEPHEMPVDSQGNRADIIMSGESTVSRMNPGRKYEQFLNACGREVQVNHICKELGIKPKQMSDTDLQTKLEVVERQQPQLFDRIWGRLMRLYEIVSPAHMAVWFRDGEYRRPRTEHMTYIINHGVHFYFPTDNPVEMVDMVNQLQEEINPVFGPVDYIGYSGKKVRTVDNVRIAPVYMLLLEKIADDWTAVASGKVQHLGVLAPVSSSDKFSTPTRTQPIRAWGESEVRIAVSYIGAPFVAEKHDRDNNPATHKELLINLLNADRPTDVPCLVDRKKHPLGGSRPLMLVKHIMECGGIRFAWKPFQPHWEKDPNWKREIRTIYKTAKDGVVRAATKIANTLKELVS